MEESATLVNKRLWPISTAKPQSTGREIEHNRVQQTYKCCRTNEKMVTYNSVTRYTRCVFISEIVHISNVICCCCLWKGSSFSQLVSIECTWNEGCTIYCIQPDECGFHRPAAVARLNGKLHVIFTVKMRSKFESKCFTFLQIIRMLFVVRPDVCSHSQYTGNCVHENSIKIKYEIDVDNIQTNSSMD